ncbi:MAG: hypothetical protein ACYCZW_01220 [Minisyncoccota bacterium]
MDTTKSGKNSLYKEKESDEVVISTENSFSTNRIGIKSVWGEENTNYISPYNQTYTKKKKVTEAGSTFLDKLYEGITPGQKVEMSFSPSFTKRNVAKLVSDIGEHGLKWIELFKSPDELLHIRTIYKALEERAKYFDFEPKTRIFLGNIQNFFVYWKDVEIKHIEQFLRSLDRFKSGDISEESLGSFSQEIFLIQSRIKNAKNSEDK